jgi:oligoendopeptidase F
MGYDIDAMVKQGSLTLDLYPRKGKNTHGFCFGVKAGKDSRILANLSNNVISLDTLNHELGHCVYDLGLSLSLPFMDREPASSAFTEAIAMMMGDIMKLENVLLGIVPEEILNKFKNTHSEDEANFVSRSLLIIDFEKELYANPEQSPADLWHGLKIKYLNRDEEPNNEWATIPHYLSHPAYYQNYFRATIMKAQIYSHLRSKLGNITENKSTAEYLKNNIFSFGSSINEYELIHKLTGKPFGITDFIASM